MIKRSQKDYGPFDYGNEETKNDISDLKMVRIFEDNVYYEGQVNSEGKYTGRGI